MSNPSTVTYSLIAGVANGAALSQAVASAKALTLNGSLVTAGVATFDNARRVVVTSANAGDAGLVFTVTGTNRYGFPQTSTATLATVAGTTSGYTALDFLTVTAITAPSATAGNITAGTNGIGSTDWLIDNWLAPNWSMTVIFLGPAGTNYTLETTLDDPCFVAGQPYSFSLAPSSNSPPIATAWPNLTDVAGNNQAQFAPGDMCYAHRMTIVAGTGPVTMQSIQAGIGSP